MTAYVHSGGKIEITLPDGTLSERTIPSGIAIHNPIKDRHRVKNIGDTQIKIYLVERMVTHEPYRLDLELPEIVSPNVYKVLLDNEEVKVLEVIFEPGEGDLMHEHGVITYFALNGGKMKNTLFDGTESEMKIPDNFAGHGSKVVKHKMKNIAVIDKGWIGVGNTGRITTIIRLNYFFLILYSLIYFLLYSNFHCYQKLFQNLLSFLVKL